MGNPMSTHDPMGTGLGTKLNPSWVMGFLAGKFYIHGHEFGLTKPSGFIPVAISTRQSSRSRFYPGETLPNSNLQRSDSMLIPQSDLLK